MGEDLYVKVLWF